MQEGELGLFGGPDRIREDAEPEITVTHRAGKEALLEKPALEATANVLFAPGSPTPARKSPQVAVTEGRRSRSPDGSTMWR